MRPLRALWTLLNLNSPNLDHNLRRMVIMTEEDWHLSLSAAQSHPHGEAAAEHSVDQKRLPTQIYSFQNSRILLSRCTLPTYTPDFRS